MEVAGNVTKHSRKSDIARFVRKHIIAFSSPLQFRIFVIETRTNAFPGGREGDNV